MHFVYFQILGLLFLVSTQVYSDDIVVEEQKDDLVESESKDPGKVEIIKQIKRVNADGSYTFGYEAEDGTFKIESRDVLGNVKGTFGFVDQDGEIKRVSYSSSNGSEPSNDKSVVQSIPRHNRTVSTTRRPTIIFPNITPSPSSTVIQTIPRRRTSLNQNQTTTTTERPVYKHIVKSSDYEISSSRTTTEAPRVLSSHQRTIYQNGHFIRSTLSPQVDVQRYTEGQLIRPTNPETVTPRPNDNYVRRLIVTRNPLLDEQINPTIKPISEDTEEDNVRGNLLRRQLTQEKVSDYDARQHVLNLHQSTGNDATDVHSGSLTTGTPRPLFTTTLRPRIQSTTTSKGIISPAKYPVVFQKNAIRGPRINDQFTPESTTDASNIAETNYVTPTPIPIVQIPQIPPDEHYFRGRPLPRGAILIPVQNRYYDDHQDYQQFVPQEQYIRDDGYLHQPTPVPRVTPVPIIPVPIRRPEQRMEYMDDYIRPYQVPVNTDLQDDIDNIKPPVSTLDFQKLLNRLIIRQNHLREISRIENIRAMQDPYYDRYRPQPNPVSLYIRQNSRPNNGPVQFIPRNRYFVPHMMQHRMESQQYHQTIDPYDNYEPIYRHGRRVARLLDPNMRPKDEENYLPAEVREMLLLKMLQLAINPNLPVPPSEQELMTTANPPHRKEAVRNVQILGEEQEQEKRNVRSKRYHGEQEEMDYY